MCAISQTEACMLQGWDTKALLHCDHGGHLHGCSCQAVVCRVGAGHTRVTRAAADCHAASRMATHLQHAVDHEAADDAEHAPRQLKPLIGLQPVDELFQAAAQHGCDCALLCSQGRPSCCRG